MKWKWVLSFCLFSASVVTLAVSGFQLIQYGQEEQQTNSLQAELAAVYAAGNETYQHSEPDETAYVQETQEESLSPNAWTPVSDETAALDITEPTIEPVVPDGVSAQSETTTSSGLSALHARNTDCVAWITIEGTVIDYPVMHRPDRKDYYLNRDFNGKKSAAGTLYISEICDPETSDNVLIHGHNMNSGKMFAALTKYKKRSFYEDHRYIRFETLEGVHTYEVIFALTTPVYTGNDFEYYNFATARNEAEFDAYIAQCARRAVYDTGLSVTYGDKLLTLSTCEYSQKNGRILVVAKRIDE